MINQRRQIFELYSSSHFPFLQQVRTSRNFNLTLLKRQVYIEILFWWLQSRSKVLYWAQRHAAEARRQAHWQSWLAKTDRSNWIGARSGFCVLSGVGCRDLVEVELDSLQNRDARSPLIDSHLNEILFSEVVEVVEIYPVLGKNIDSFVRI